MNWIEFFHYGLVNLDKAVSVRIDGSFIDQYNFVKKEVAKKEVWIIQIWFEKEGAHYEKYFDDKDSCQKAYGIIQEKLCQKSL